MFPNFYDIVCSQTITRPADTTAYASGDLVANSTTAGSVTPFSIPNVTTARGLPAVIKRVRLRKSGATVTNANIRVHLFTVSPTVGAGDNAAISIATGSAGYIGSVDVASMQAMTDGGAGFVAADIAVRSQTLYALLEARAAYTPANAETFTLSLEVAQQ